MLGITPAGGHGPGWSDEVIFSKSSADVTESLNHIQHILIAAGSKFKALVESYPKFKITGSCK